MDLKLPQESFRVPNPLTGFGMKQDNFDNMHRIGVIPGSILAFETPARFIGPQGPGFYPLTGLRKIWHDRTASPSSGAARSYWAIDKDDEGNARYWPAPASATDPILSDLGRVASQPAVSLYRQYASWMPKVPAQAIMTMPEAEAARISFSPIGFTPDIPLGVGEFNYQNSWVPVFAEFVGDSANKGEVYMVHVEKFVQANPLNYNAPYQPTTPAQTPKTAEQKAAIVAMVTAIVTARAPVAAKYDQIVEAMK
jgi:hypothetical protein